MTADAGLYRLLAWLSPSYPIGAFSYSHGVEYAVESGLVRDRGSLVGWIDGVLRHGAGRTDGALFAHAWRAADAGDAAMLDDICDLAAAWRGSSELALESRQQGASFLSITRAAWPHPALDALSLRRDGQVALPVAVAAAAAAHGVALEPALLGYMHAFASNLVSSALRLALIGQSDGQIALATLEGSARAAAAAALAAGDLDDVGSAAVLVDWCSMRHETQYTRLFRS